MLGYQYVSASQVLATLAGINVDPSSHWWLERGADLSQARSNHELDRELDRKMITMTRESDCQVFDAWALPWISSESMLRIWLESDPPSRYRKCQVSHAPYKSFSVERAQEIVEDKDAESRRIFLALHNFDLFDAPDVFDVRVDLSELIPQASVACAAQGISRADAFLGQAALAALGRPEASPRALAVAETAMPAGSVLSIKSDAGT